MKKLIVSTIACLLLAVPCYSQVKKGTALSTTPNWEDYKWGDLGDGTFANPVLNADYSDPDVIRVGDKYYMTCSEFHFMGMPILVSDDMVNWRIVAQIYKQIGLDKFDRMEGYGDGTWAPTLRYHDGQFYMYVCMPHTGLYMSTAPKAEGPWAPLHQVKAVDRWEDPCPFWDEDGNAYLGHSVLGAGPIIIHRMSPDGKSLLDDGKTVYEGPVAEGTKLFKRDGYYYLSIPEGGVGTGWQMVLRSKDIYGPYEGKRVLEQGSTPINGPHQGALVDTPSGQWWFYHFQDTNPLGRVLHLQPVTWQSDGFPTIGYDYDGNGVGEPMKIIGKPDTGKKRKPMLPQTNDKFDHPTLGLQWQTNHNPQQNAITLTARKGKLGIKALPAQKVEKAFNQLTQKTMGFRSEAIVKLYVDEMTAYQRAGMACLGNRIVGVGVMVTADGGHVLYLEDGDHVYQQPLALSSPKSPVWIRLTLDAVQNSQQFAFSLDGKHFSTIGDAFPERSHGWKGARISLYSYTTDDSVASGTAYFDDFTYKTDGGPSK